MTQLGSSFQTLSVLSYEENQSINQSQTVSHSASLTIAIQLRMTLNSWSSWPHFSSRVTGVPRPIECLLRILSWSPHTPGAHTALMIKTPLPTLTFEVTRHLSWLCPSVLTFLCIHVTCFVYMQFLSYSMYCFNPIMWFPQTILGAAVRVGVGGQNFSNPILKVTWKNFTGFSSPSPNQYVLLPSHSIANTPVKPFWFISSVIFQGH